MNILLFREKKSVQKSRNVPDQVSHQTTRSSIQFIMQTEVCFSGTGQIQMMVQTLMKGQILKGHIPVEGQILVMWSHE